MLNEGRIRAITRPSAFFAAEGFGSGPPIDGLETTIPDSRWSGCAICHASTRPAPML